MDITITPKKLLGSVHAIPSKSQAHRLLICAAFSDKKTILQCTETNQDIEATADCLRSLGANIERMNGAYIVEPIIEIQKKATLHCRESGSTLRFMLPIVGALGIDAIFILEGRLPYRPLSPLWEEMERCGCVLSRPTETTLRCVGKLCSGNYKIDGSVSSQFITGLLFALALIPGEHQLEVTGKIESKPYIEITQHALAQFGVTTHNFKVIGSYPFSSPGLLCVEGDWSNGAFFLAAQQLGNDVHVQGLSTDSVQGDKIVSHILSQLSNSSADVDAADTPDLVPILAVVAGAMHGATFRNIKRLRLKESDRIETVCNMLHSLGSHTEVSENELRVYPARFCSCTIHSSGDHRIAMAAAIAATVADGPITILDAQCVCKSYPTFWDDYHRLGGQYE